MLPQNPPDDELLSQEVWLMEQEPERLARLKAGACKVQPRLT